MTASEGEEEGVANVIKSFLLSFTVWQSSTASSQRRTSLLRRWWLWSDLSSPCSAVDFSTGNYTLTTATGERRLRQEH